jgi:hypothetical protein
MVFLGIPYFFNAFLLYYLLFLSTFVVAISKYDEPITYAHVV